MEYRIGDFSQVTRLTVKTLHYYHELGLLVPCRVEASGYRWYDEAAIRRAGVIRTLKSLEFTLDEIREILASARDDGDLIDVARHRLAEVEGRLARGRAVRDRLVLLLNTERGGEIMKTYDESVSWTTVGETRVASIRFTGRYDQIGAFYGRLFKLYGRFAAGPPLALYYDTEFREADASMEACLPLRPSSPAVSKEGAEVRVIPAQRMAQLVHRGPYDEVGPSYRKIFDFLAAEGARAAVPSREVYLKGPGLILPRSPKRFVTLIQVPAD
jgi:DNA-binding transcriptional MerR regulator/effector-binding domain-containing protein